MTSVQIAIALLLSSSAFLGAQNVYTAFPWNEQLGPVAGCILFFFFGVHNLLSRMDGRSDLLHGVIFYRTYRTRVRSLGVVVANVECRFSLQKMTNGSVLK